jgi:6-phosphofructokinase 1
LLFTNIKVIIMKEDQSQQKTIAVMTSGGDAQGMNAAVRAVVRCSISLGIRIFAIHEGYQGMVDNRISQMSWDSVSGILNQGGTMIGTARCPDFRERYGRVIAAKNLVNNGIDNLIIIGGDGSLTGASEFSDEWTSLLEELVEKNEIPADSIQKYKQLKIVGLVGSIDNDMANTDMTIGADSALHRIIEATDAIKSTAASHHRTFIVEVMGRNCGYLALVSAIASGAGWVFVPEYPPFAGWENKICDVLKSGMNVGRHDCIVIVAEGARDRQGNPITCEKVKKILDEGMGIDSRITILGHVQRGGTPSAYDRYMSTVEGHYAVNEILKESDNNDARLVVMQKNRIDSAHLMDSVNKNKEIAQLIKDKQFEKAQELRGASWNILMNMYRTLCLSLPRGDESTGNHNLAIMNCGWPAPGMNAAVRAAVRIGLDRGHKIYQVNNGFEGMISGDFREMEWMEVEEWVSLGGSKIGSNRTIPQEEDLFNIAKNLEKYEINGIMMIGGWAGYEGMRMMYEMRDAMKPFNIPFICIPASINNSLPGCEVSIGADTALNNIVMAVDMIKNSADSSHRAFIVEVMGRYCGYLAAMSGMATGAEEVYLHEAGINLDKLRRHVKRLVKSFGGGRNVGLYIRNEYADDIYTTDFISKLFEAESEKLFDVKQIILGPLQQGGNPSPFDRTLATRLAFDGINHLIDCIEKGDKNGYFIGFGGTGDKINDFRKLEEMSSREHERPREQWWEELFKVSADMAHNPLDQTTEKKL